MLTGVAEPELNAGKEKDAGAWEAETQTQQLQEWRFSGARGRDSNQMVWFRFPSLLKENGRRQKRI